MRITVFTPTYNRGYCIEDLYHSLQRQSFCDFEWLVIDDGSTDQTEALFDRWMLEEQRFPIVYKKKQNAGKHLAINDGVSLARGSLFFIVDSDDVLSDTALERIDAVEKTIPSEQRECFCGVCGLCGGKDGEMIGTTYRGNDFLDATALERSKNGINGDKAEVFYTEVIRKYPFPSFEGERFVSEALVWDRMAHDGLKLRFFNEIIYICEYLPDGLTNAGFSLYAANPQGWGAYIQQEIAFGKVQGIEVWNEQLRFYYNTRETLPFSKIARYLGKKPAAFWLRLLGVRVFYKLYQIN